MIEFYVDRIKRGKTTIDKVPLMFRQQVEELLAAE